ncbi:MAG: hypothetical protein ACK5C5_04415 [Bacteroidota bacterium]|jgi:hypothetical protein
MMTYPPDQSKSEASDTLENLLIMRRELMEQLRNKDSESAKPQPCHSLFSSARNYREDELSCGLENRDANLAGFANN